MGKIIMASPKVIAVTFDQSNSMKNKYNEYIKSIANENTTIETEVRPIQEGPVLFDSPENNEIVNSSNHDNLFSSQSDDEVINVASASQQESVNNSLKKAMDGVTLSDNDLKELEDGLIEVIKIAELSIHSVIEQYRQKGKKTDVNTSEDTISAENNNSNLNSNNIFESSSNNIFDVPSDSKRIA